MSGDIPLRVTQVLRWMPQLRCCPPNTAISGSIFSCPQRRQKYNNYWTKYLQKRFRTRSVFAVFHSVLLRRTNRICFLCGSFSSINPKTEWNIDNRLFDSVTERAPILYFMRRRAQMMLVKIWWDAGCLWHTTVHNQPRAARILCLVKCSSNRRRFGKSGWHEPLELIQMPLFQQVNLTAMQVLVEIVDESARLAERLGRMGIASLEGAQHALAPIPDKPKYICESRSSTRECTFH